MKTLYEPGKMFRLVKHIFWDTEKSEKIFVSGCGWVKDYDLKKFVVLVKERTGMSITQKEIKREATIAGIAAIILVKMDNIK